MVTLSHPEKALNIVNALDGSSLNLRAIVVAEMYFFLLSMQNVTHNFTSFDLRYIKQLEPNNHYQQFES